MPGSRLQYKPRVISDTSSQRVRCSSQVDSAVLAVTSLNWAEQKYFIRLSVVTGGGGHRVEATGELVLQPNLRRQRRQER